MSRAAKIVLVAVLAVLGSADTRAARDRPAPTETAGAAGTAAAAAAARLEILVLEIETCAICPLVRQQLLPRWEETTWARTVPMRFVDVTRRDERTLGLAAPIDTVPTFVLLRDGREIERIAGYLGPTNFIEAIGHIIRREGDGEER